MHAQNAFCAVYAGFLLVLIVSVFVWLIERAIRLPLRQLKQVIENPSANLEINIDKLQGPIEDLNDLTKNFYFLWLSK